MGHQFCPQKGENRPAASERRGGEEQPNDPLVKKLSKTRKRKLDLPTLHVARQPIKLKKKGKGPGKETPEKETTWHGHPEGKKTIVQIGRKITTLSSLKTEGGQPGCQKKGNLGLKGLRRGGKDIQGKHHAARKGKVVGN